MENKKYAVAYCRVSTDDQADNGISLDVQQEACVTALQKEGYELLEVVRDEGRSGKNLNREGIMKVLQLVEENKINAVFAISNDRIARNTMDYLYLKNRLHENKILLRYVFQQNFDESATSKAMETMTAVFSQMTSDTISEKVKKNLYAKAQAGFFPSSAPLGYLNVTDPQTQDKMAFRIIIPDPQKAPLIKEAFTLYATGNYNAYDLNDLLYEKGLRSRNGLKLSPSIFYDMLKNPVYVGEVHWGEIHQKEGKHEPIIDRETFNCVQSILAGHNNHACRRRKYTWLLNGFIWCVEHGHRYTAEWHLNKHISYYHCSHRFGCGKYIPTEELEEKVANKFKELEFEEQFINTVVSKARGIISKMKTEALTKKQSLINQRTALEAKKRVAQEKLIEKVLSNDEFIKIKKEIDENLGRIEERIQNEENNEYLSADILEEILKFSQNIYETYMKAPQHLKRHYLSFFWNKFEVAEGVIIKSYSSLLFEELLALKQAHLNNIKNEKTPENKGSSSVILRRALLPE